MDCFRLRFGLPPPPPRGSRGPRNPQKGPFLQAKEASKVSLWLKRCAHVGLPQNVGDRFLSSAGAGGECARPMRLPDPSPVLDKNRAPIGPEILSSKISVCEVFARGQSKSVKRHLSRRHLSVLNLKFDFIFDVGRTREEQIAHSLKRHLFPHGCRKPKVFWIYFSTLPPILKIFRTQH